MKRAFLTLTLMIVAAAIGLGVVGLREALKQGPLTPYEVWANTAHAPLTDLDHKSSALNDPSKVTRQDMLKMAATIRTNRAKWVAVPLPPASAKVPPVESLRTKRRVTAGFDQLLALAIIPTKISTSTTSTQAAQMKRRMTTLGHQSEMNFKALDDMDKKYCPDHKCRAMN